MQNGWREFMPEGSERGFTVLIVEDEADNSEIMRSVVEEILGYRALLASNGVEALSMTQAHMPGIILMDLMMPVLDGFEAIRRLKADPETRNIPIIAVTALSRPLDPQRVAEAGADGYIAKPFNLDLLADIIQRYAQPVPTAGHAEEHGAGH